MKDHSFFFAPFLCVQTIAAAASLLLANSASAEGARESFKIHFAERVPTPPTLDGRLDEPAWKAAPAITDFGPCGRLRIAATVMKTEVKYLWDDKYLYIGTVCHEDTPENFANFLNEQMNRDLPPYNRDCIEVHIDGNNDGHTRFQSWLNGTRDKQIIWHYDFGWGLLEDGNYGLNADWDYRVTFDKTNLTWTCEARYALAHVEIKPVAGYMFGVETCRFRIGKNLLDLEGKPMPTAWQLTGWGTQGQSHHNVSSYGKVVLVEKQPKSLAEGLALAYPDLDRRTLYVQLSDSFVVLDKGKTARLTYLEKAKAVLAEVEHLERRLADFLAANPAPEKNQKFYVSATEQVAKIEKAYRECKRSLASAKTYEIGPLNALLGNSAKWKSAYDDAYWRSVFAWERADGRVRQRVTLKPDPSYPDEDAGEADRWPRPDVRRERCVAWAKPLAKGAPRVLICVDSRGAYDAWGLTNRLDLAAEIFVQNRDAIGPTGDYFREGFPLVAGKRKMLEKRLARRAYDGFVFIGCSPTSWPWELQCWLNERVLEGARVVVVGPEDGWGFPRNGFVADAELAAGQAGPFQCLANESETSATDRTETWRRLGTWRHIAYGKGLCAVYGMKGQRDYVCDLLTPSWPKSHDRLFEQEYQIAHAVRAVMAALGKRGDARVLSVAATEPPVAARPGAIAVTLAAGEPAAVELRWTLRRQDGEELKSGCLGPINLPAGKSHVSVMVPELEAGEYTLDAWVQQERGVLDFASGRFTVKAVAPKPCGCGPLCRQTLPTAALGAVAMKRTLEPKDPIAASVAVSNAVAGLVVSCEISDRTGRVLEKGERTLAKGETGVRFSFTQARQRDTVGFLSLVLRDERGLRLDAKSLDFYRHVGPLTDYQIYTEEVEPVGGEHLLARQALKQYYGIELNQDGPVEKGYCGAMPVVFAHIPGHSCNQGGSLSNPWYHEHLRKRYAKIAAKLKSQNGRFVSVGDDSGPPAGFGRAESPDWLPPLRDRIYAMAKRNGWKTRTFWQLLGYDRQPCGGDGFTHWSFDMPLRSGDRALLLVTNRVSASYFDEVRRAFREAYPSVERMNVACGTALKSWDDFKPATLRAVRIPMNPQYVHFLFWLRDRYKTVEALNAAWGASEKDFFTIPAGRIAELRAAGKFAANIDMKTYLEDVFASVFKSIHQGVHGVDPTIGLGFGASDVGNSLPEVLRYLDTALPYAGSEQIEIARGQPHKLMGETIGIYGGRKIGRTARERTVWHGLLTGCNFSWFWHGGMAMHGDRTIQGGRCRYLYEFYREIQQGPAALLLRSQRQNDGIRILLSRDSGHLDALRAPGTTHRQSRQAFAGIVTDLGFQYDYVTTKEVEAGALLSSRARLLVLPCLQVLTEREAGKIREFIQRGGCVLYDIEPGACSPDGRTRERPLLGEPLAEASKKGRAFKLPYKAASYGFLRGRGELGGRRDELAKFFGAAGLKPLATTVDKEGRPVTNIEYSRFVRGGLTCLGVEKSSNGFEKYPKATTVRLAATNHVYDVRAGRYLGKTDTLPVTFQGMDTRLFALLPYEVRGVSVEVNEKPQRGETLVVKAKLLTDASASGRARDVTHVLRVEMVPPQGFSVFELPPIRTQLVDAPKGEATVEIPLAWNEKVPYYDLVITDVATGLSVRRKIEL